MKSFLFSELLFVILHTSFSVEYTILLYNLLYNTYRNKLCVLYDQLINVYMYVQCSLQYTIEYINNESYLLFIMYIVVHNKNTTVYSKYILLFIIFIQSESVALL